MQHVGSSSPTRDGTQPLHWELGVLATGPSGKSLVYLFGFGHWKVHSQTSTPPLPPSTRSGSSWVALPPLLLLLLSRFSRVRLCATPETAAHQAARPWASPGKNTGVGCHFFLQRMKVKVKSLSCAHS